MSKISSPTCYITIVTLAIILTQGSAFGYTPDSPEVKAMVQKALKYLEKNNRGQFAEMLGGKCLIGLAAYKATHNENHPLVREAVNRCRAVVSGSEKVPVGGKNNSNYSLGIALIFLCELSDTNPDKYRREAEWFVETIIKRQKPGGSWGYDSSQEGDISQTQYAALGLWIAHRTGLQVPFEPAERMANFLIRVQDPNGGYGYQARDPGSFNRVAQHDDIGDGKLRAAMAAPAVGSLYVAAELLGIIKPEELLAARQLPSAIKPVMEESGSSPVNVAFLKRAVADGDRFFEANSSLEQRRNQAYFLYSVERYIAFREFAKTGKISMEPAWYDAGVRFLQKRQGADGSFSFGEVYGAAIETPFCMLFLGRSAQQTVQRLVIEKGRLTGGKGLGNDLSTAQVDAKGRVVTADGAKAMSDILAMLDDPKAPQAVYISAVPEKLELSADPNERQAQLVRLRRMIINGSFQARLTAAKTLGTVRNLESAPALIFALSDPDQRVVRAARDGLRFMSRKPEGFGLVVSGERPEKHLWQRAQKDWTNWLLSVKPDAELIE